MSLEFDGTTYVSDDSGAGSFSGAGLVPDNTYPCSFLSICKPFQAVSGDTLLSRWAAGNGNLAYILYFGAGGRLTLGLHDGLTNGVSAVSSSDTPLFQWKWFGGIQEAPNPDHPGGLVQVWEDGFGAGAFSGSVQVGGAGQGDGAPYAGSAQGGGSGGKFVGLQRFEAVWKKNLVFAEWQAIYNGGVYDADVICAVAPADLVGAWDFDNLAVDLSGKGWPLTNHGGVPSSDNPPEPDPVPAGYPPALSPPIMHGRGAA